MNNYIVLDLEWNQGSGASSGDGLTFEIIEIGAVKLNEKLEIIDGFHGLIRPVVHPELHFKIREMTKFTNAELAGGGSFTEVFQSFLDWCGKDFTFCTWGSMDLEELQNNLDYFGLDNPFPKPLFYFDLQKLYGLSLGSAKDRFSLDSVVSALGLPQEGQFHRALEDARYTAQVMRAMEFERVKAYVSVDYHRPPQNRREEISLDFGSYSKFVSQVYDTKEDAMADRKLTSTTCYVCGRTLRKKIRWFSSNAKFYFCLAICPEHGFLKGKIRMKKADGGRVFAVKTLKLVGQDGADAIKKKQEEQRKRRAVKRRLKAAEEISPRRRP